MHLQMLESITPRGDPARPVPDVISRNKIELINVGIDHQPTKPILAALTRVLDARYWPQLLLPNKLQPHGRSNHGLAATNVMHTAVHLMMINIL